MHENDLAGCLTLGKCSINSGLCQLIIFIYPMSSAWAGKLNQVTDPLSPSSPSIYSDPSQIGWADVILLLLVLDIF